MTLQFDPQNDFAKVVDDLQSITLMRPGSSMSVVISKALRRSTITTDLSTTRNTHVANAKPATQKGFAASDVTWHFSTSALSETPQPGDLILSADAQRWTVLAVRQMTLQTRWVCVCRNLAVVHGLNGYIDIERATYAKGDNGADEPTWRIWKTGLRASILPVDAEVTDQNQRRTTNERFKVLLADVVAIDHEHRIKGPDGTRYRVVGSRKAERIDALMQIDVVRIS